MTNSGLEAFMNLVNSQMFYQKEETSKILIDTLYHKLTKDAIQKGMVEEYTILRKYIDSRDFPFDSTSFLKSSENASNIKTTSLTNQSNYGELCKQYVSRLVSDDRSKEFMIYFENRCSIDEIRLLFSEHTGKSYSMIIKIYGYYGEQEVLIFNNTYSDSLYCYLVQNSFLKEYGMYNDSDTRNAL